MKQVAHVDPVVANPTVSAYTGREAGRLNQKRVDGQMVFDAGWATAGPLPPTAPAAPIATCLKAVIVINA